jgi:prephenate dehydrogenase
VLELDRVLVVGVGLIGASWALALRRAGFAGSIHGFDVEERAVAGFDSCSIGDPPDVRRGDLVVLATPVARIVETLRGPACDWPEGAVVTDCGSTKRTICEAAKGLRATFVGGHPMAGSEWSGPEAAREDLFEGAAYFLCAENKEVERLVRSLGARVVSVTPEEHDGLIAWSSHLPQLVSSALAAIASERGVTGGPGLESMTRLASSSWSMWRDILMTNGDEIDEPIARMIAELERMREALGERDFNTLAGYFRRRASRE